MADGVADSDAATVGQLEAVTQDTRYFAANGGVDSDTAAYVDGEYTTASGESSTATGEGAVWCDEERLLRGERLCNKQI